MLTPGGKFGLGPPLTLIPGGRLGRGPPLTLIPGGRFGRGPPLTLIPGGRFGLGPPVTVIPGGSLGASLELLPTEMPSFDSLSMSLFLSGSSERDTWIPKPASLSIPADLCADLGIEIIDPSIIKKGSTGILTQSLQQPFQLICQGEGWGVVTPAGQRCQGAIASEAGCRPWRPTASILGCQSETSRLPVAQHTTISCRTHVCVAQTLFVLVQKFYQ